MILAHGMVAAQKIRDSRALAYFAHEDGIRLLGLGKRVAAGAALGTAFALWQSLGDSVGMSATEGGGALTTLPPSPVPEVVTPAESVMPRPDLGSAPPPDPISAQPAEFAQPTQFPPPPESVLPPPPQYAPPPATIPPHGAPFPAPAPAPWPIAETGHVATTTAVHAGMPLIVKLVIIIAAVAVGGFGAYAVTDALITDNSGRSADNSTGTKPGTVYYVIRSKHLSSPRGLAPRTACEERIPGELGVSVSTVVCTVEGNQADNVNATFQVTELLDERAADVRVLHWGCAESAPSRTCHVDFNDQPKTICVSTSMDDLATRTACERDAGNKAPDSPPIPTG
jgi:hypothetical protein